MYIYVYLSRSHGKMLLDRAEVLLSSHVRRHIWQAVVPRMWGSTGCPLNIVFFQRFWYIFRTLFSLGVSVCTHARHVEHQRCNRSGTVQKIFKEKTQYLMDTLYSIEHFQEKYNFAGTAASDSFKLWILTWCLRRYLEYAWKKKCTFKCCNSSIDDILFL